jgi:hypothetical protein
MTDDPELGPITHIAVTSDGTKVTLYVNGRFIVSIPPGVVAGTIEWWPPDVLPVESTVAPPSGSAGLCHCGDPLDEIGRCTAVTDFGQHRGQLIGRLVPKHD